MTVTISAQVAAMAALVERASPDKLVRAGFSARRSEAELLRDHLIAGLGSLRWLQANEAKIKAAISGGGNDDC